MKMARLRVVSVASGVAVYQDGTGFVGLSCRGGGFSSDMTTANINSAWNSAEYLTTTAPPGGFGYQICASTATTTPPSCIPATQRVRPTSSSLSANTGSASSLWSVNLYGTQSIVNLASPPYPVGQPPSWAGQYAMGLTGSNYLDFGTQTFGGTFSIAVLSAKTAVPAGNNPVFDFASSADGVQLFYAGTGHCFGYYDGRMYQSYTCDTSTNAVGVWNYDVLVFEDVTDAARCTAAGGGPTSSCTIIAGYRNGQLVPVAKDIYAGSFGLNPVVKGLIGGQYGSLPKTSRSGLYLGKSNWPQSGFVGYVADFQFFQDVALSAQNVSYLYSGVASVCD